MSRRLWSSEISPIKDERPGRQRDPTMDHMWPESPSSSSSSRHLFADLPSLPSSPMTPTFHDILSLPLLVSLPPPPLLLAPLPCTSPCPSSPGGEDDDNDSISGDLHGSPLPPLVFSSPSPPCPSIHPDGKITVSFSIRGTSQSEGILTPVLGVSRPLIKWTFPGERLFSTAGDESKAEHKVLTRKRKKRADPQRGLKAKNEARGRFMYSDIMKDLPSRVASAGLLTVIMVTGAAVVDTVDVVRKVIAMVGRTAAVEVLSLDPIVTKAQFEFSSGLKPWMDIVSTVAHTIGKVIAASTARVLLCEGPIMFERKPRPIGDNRNREYHLFDHCFRRFYESAKVSFIGYSIGQSEHAIIRTQMERGLTTLRERMGDLSHCRRELKRARTLSVNYGYSRELIDSAPEEITRVITLL